MISEMIQFVLIVLLMGFCFVIGHVTGKEKEKIQIIERLSQGECVGNEGIEYEECMKDTKDILGKAINGR